MHCSKSKVTFDESYSEPDATELSSLAKSASTAVYWKAGGKESPQQRSIT